MLLLKGLPLMDILDVKLIQKGSLLCELTLAFPVGIKVQVVLMNGSNGYFIKYPSRDYVDKAGEKKSWSLVRWADKERGDKCCAWVVAQLKSSHPELFGTVAPKSSGYSTYDEDDLPF